MGRSANQRFKTDSHDVDMIGVDGTMRYLGDLGVKLDDVTVLAILTELSAPTMGELTRDGFVGGWKKLQYVSLSSPASCL